MKRRLSTLNMLSARLTFESFFFNWLTLKFLFYYILFYKYFFKIKGQVFNSLNLVLKPF
jgi:hypothetical protein